MVKPSAVSDLTCVFKGHDRRQIRLSHLFNVAEACGKFSRIYTVPGWQAGHGMNSDLNVLIYTHTAHGNVLSSCFPLMNKHKNKASVMV